MTVSEAGVSVTVSLEDTNLTFSASFSRASLTDLSSGNGTDGLVDVSPSDAVCLMCQNTRR